MFLEIDEIAIPVEDWTGVLRGDQAARERVSARVGGKFLRHNETHYGAPGVTAVSLRQLYRFGLIGGVRVVALGDPQDGEKNRAEIKIVPIEGAGVCEVGDTPASGTTCGELADRLMQFGRDTRVGFNIGIGSNLKLFSLYQAYDTRHVWLDLGEAKDG